MDTNDTNGGGDQDQEPLHPVPERPTPSGWVIVKKASTAKKTPAPVKARAKSKAAAKKKPAPARKKTSSTRPGKTTTRKSARKGARKKARSR